MYNLNYNVTNARLNRPTGRPFVPSPSYDAYSASLVVAIPGNIFYSGYYNVFNMQFPFSDISAQIRSGVFNYSTNQYDTVGTNVPTLYTGSLGHFETSSVNNFTNNSSFITNGYNYSLLMTGSVALNIGTASLLELGSGSAGAWAIEGWFAFDNTGSYTLIGPPEAQELRNNQPSRPVVWKYKGSTQASSSYVFYAGWTGENRSVNPYYITTGSIAAFIQPISSSLILSEAGVYPTVSSSYKAKQFNHYAFSSQPYAGGATYRTYFNGQLIGSQTVSGSINPLPNINTLLFGTLDYENPVSASQQAGMYIQDFRLYNGTNKNYTGSSFPVPSPMIVSIQEPYQTQL